MKSYKQFIGVLFKEKTCKSFKNYIQQYRYNLLEQRLKHGNTGTKQLTLEFGFTDESYLHKFVKGYSVKNIYRVK